MPDMTGGDYPVGMAYVPWQRWGAVYDLEKGLSCGTVFPDLNKPFLGVRGGCR
ncbi:MAG: spore coat associated protein CotJA [Eubacteriales bacterium]|nr:spore coat associated protein CotJA [Eubacteriales bacterium]